MKIAALLAAVLLLPQTAWAQDRPSLPCGDADKACARQAMQNHAAIRLDSWTAALALPVAGRIGAAPPQLVEYIRLDNIANDFPERPRAAGLDAGLLADIRGAMADLPAAIWQLFGERLVGVYLVEGLGGTGYTDYVLDPQGKPLKGFVVLDAAVLAQQSANAWATWKENTPFAPGAGYRLDARIEADGDDNRRNAIQYILLHELGHVFSIGAEIHPPWNVSPKDVAAEAAYPFFDLSWRIDRTADKYRSRFDADFPQRASTVYYFGAKLSAADMQPTYASLRRTNFPSLYAATVPGDDFAESFASYVHGVLMRRPWQITISHEGRVAEVFRSCWGEPRCAEKQRMLERLLNLPP
ncbi:MAG: hypothetical protein U1A72_18190 [Sulfuritalea sp.]|nr:hypothetical protein [Sulfuritalea sp.]